MRDVVVLALVVLAAAPVSAADVTLVGPNGRIELSEAAQSEISAIVKREAESCSLSSVVMRLGVRREPPVLASEVLIGTDDPRFPRQPLTRHQDVVTMHGKCSGLTGIELMCLPALRPYFEKSATDNCHLLGRAGQQQH